MTLQGRGIIITGANQGLGRQIADECVRQGANVVLCARNSTLLQSAAADLKTIAAPDQIVAAVTADVSNPADVSALMDFAGHHLTKITGLVNNAGVYGPKGLIEDVDWEEWVTAIHINLMGNRTVKVLPSPGTELTSILPPAAETSSRAMASPSPVLPWVEKNGSKMRS